MARIYLLLALVGAAIPLVLSALFIADHGWDGERLIEPLRHNSLALMAFLDLVFSVLVFLVWSFRDSRARGIAGWPIIAVVTAVVGLCSGLPAYFYLREREASGA